MKKTIAFMSLVVFALACAAPPTNKDLADTNRATNRSAEAPSPLLP